ncbi:type 1 glutamine amidotransferase [Rhodobacteraceae bacterium F11138]|nr:type 1 glutamine amidotransferase [Rhodobacteraceae bacterium F11138]
MKIGILQAGTALPQLREKHGDFDVLFEQLLADDDFTFNCYRVLDGVFPGSVNACDAWLVTGSAFSAYEDHDWIRKLEQFLREAYDGDRPIVGICFGHQVIAKALGGTVEKSGNGWGVGPHRYVFDGTDEPVVINAWHQDQVTVVPQSAKVVGRSDFCANAALLYGRQAYSVQAHPELDNAFLADLLKARSNIVPEHVRNDAQRALLHETPSPNVVEQIKRFFKTRSLDMPGETLNQGAG